MGLNRFRLVVIGGFSPARIDQAMQKAGVNDPKVHLHVLSPLFWTGLFPA
jgi:hypothetical protein